MGKIVRYILFWTIVLGLSVSTGYGQNKQLHKIMEDKLRFSQSLLGAIATSDFKKIEGNAEDLFALSRRAEWHVIKTPKYEVQSNEFRRACEAIIAKAKAKNIDGVTLAYFELTMSCVRCHQYVREVREARLADSHPDILAQRR